MSGLLLRLGARALGEPGAVHTAARAPFAAAPAFAEEISAASPELSPTITATDRPESISGRSAEAAGSPAVEPIRRRGPATPPPWGAIIDPPPAMVIVARGQPPRGLPAGAALMPRFESQRLEDQGLQVDVSPDPQPAESQIDQTGALGSREERRPSWIGIPAIEPLLPQQPFTPPSAASPWGDHEPRPARGPAASDRADETTEVHVTIGRIEVTAVHEPTQPRRPAPPKPAPMTLDEYLARRQGGQPGGNR